MVVRGAPAVHGPAAAPARPTVGHAEGTAGEHGGSLLRRFTASLVASEPLADLYVHSTWALIQRRGRVLEKDHELAAQLLARVEALVSEGDLSAQSRRELEQVHYGVRLFASRP